MRALGGSISMMIDLHELADQVSDEVSFLHFIAILAADWQKERENEAVERQRPFSASPLGWENGTIGTFLEAAADWGEASIDGLPLYQKPSNPWCRAAHILLAGKFYE